MRISTTRLALLLMVLVIVACTPSPASPVSPIVIDTPVPSPLMHPTNIDTPTSSPTVAFSPSVTALVTDTVHPTHTVVSTLELASLPDLIIKLMYLEMEGRQSNCVEAYTPYGIRVFVENIGLASTGPFAVDLNSTRQQVDGGLAAGQLIELHFAGTAPSGRYEAFVDVTNQVVEHQEDNNFLSFLAPTPTPPPLCTATPTPTPTP